MLYILAVCLITSNLIIMFQKIEIVKLVTISLLLNTVLSTTSLTTTNCLSGTQLTNTTSDTSAQAFVNLIYSNFYSSSDQAALRQSFTTGDTKTVNKYVTEMQIIVPFIIIGMAFAIVFVIALSCCVCEKSCPPCQSWKRDYAARPYQKFQLKCVTIFTVIFAFGITITTIMGFVYFPALEKNIKQTKCSLYKTLDIAVNGDLTNAWGGYTQLTSQFGNISAQLNTANTAINSQLSNKDWLSTDMTLLRQQNINIYTNNRFSTVLSPNPTATTSSTSSLTVVPLFISSGLGPYTLNNTMTYSIDNGFTKSTSIVADQGYKVYKAAQLLANSANNIQLNTNINLQSLSMTSNYYETTTSSLNTFTTEVFDSIFDWGLYLIQSILAFIIMASCFIILGVIATYHFQIYGCKSCVNLGWVTFGFTYFGILVMAFYLFALGGISYQFCRFYSGVISSQSSLKSFSEVSQPTSFNRIFQRLDTCLFGNGSATKQFMLLNEMETISDLYSQINTYLSMRDTSSPSYVDLSYSTTIILGWIQALRNYQKGIYKDASPSLTSQDNPNIAIQGLNKYANNGTGGVIPTCTFDYWVFDTTNCTYTLSQTIYSSALINGSNFTSTGFMCISLNQKFSSTSNSSWTVSDIANRYISQRRCRENTQAFEKIMQYAESLVNYRDSRINLYQNLIDQLTSLYNNNVAFNNKITAFTTNVNNFMTTTATLKTLVTNQVNGVDYSANCTVVGRNLRQIYNVFCINFIYKSVQFGICCIVLLGIMVGGMLTGSVFGIRYGRIDKERKIVMPQLPSLSQHSETFQKRQKSSESSSSDED